MLETNKFPLEDLNNNKCQLNEEVSKTTYTQKTPVRTPLLDKINVPEDLRQLDDGQLLIVASELREELLDTVSVTGGHLGAGLGVVELTVAIHHTFDTPRDKLIWDVGHQCYPHKILTGRREKIRTLRQKDGLSGFAKRSESLFDSFGAGHAATSISAGLGMAEANALLGKDNNVIAVIGDGSMSAGLAYEALNNAGGLNSRLIVILNDNRMSIAPPTGAMSDYLTRLTSSCSDLPKSISIKSTNKKKTGLGNSADTTLFEKLGFRYVGPVDGHDLAHLLTTLRSVRESKKFPILVHVVTEKGKGYEPAEKSVDKYHAVSPGFDIVAPATKKVEPKAPSYTSIFGQSLVQLAMKDKKIIAITAAMPEGTGTNFMREALPNRHYDVGIAEQHAVTFAAGLACEGMKPFVSIYSTFLQRGYDQVVHDVSIQNLPVRFSIDRAGFVGADGPTHAGSFDTTFLANLPGFVVMAAGDEAELKHMVTTAAAYDEGPISFRYPRGSGTGVDVPNQGLQLKIGRGRVMCQGTRIAILSFGARLQQCLMAAEELDSYGLSTTVADARFAKPLDQNLIENLVKNHEVLLTIEEGSTGGFGALVLQYLVNNSLMGSSRGNGLKIRTLTLPDSYIQHAPPEVMYANAGLDKTGIVACVFEALGRDQPINMAGQNAE